MNIDLTPIFQAVIALLASLVTYKLIPWIRARTTNEQQAAITATVRTLVFAAEQIYGAGNGDAKLDYVVKKLEERGYNVDRDQIEAAVKENLNHIVPSCEAKSSYDVNLDDLTDNQLRALLLQCDVPMEKIGACATREELENMLDQCADMKKTEPPTQGGEA